MSVTAISSNFKRKWVSYKELVTLYEALAVKCPNRITDKSLLVMLGLSCSIDGTETILDGFDD